MEQNYYRILRLPNFADEQRIKRSFKQMALLYHPDRNPDNPEAEEMFKKVNEAYQVLSDPTLKAQYDRAIRYSSGHSSGYSSDYSSSQNTHSSSGGASADEIRRQYEYWKQMQEQKRRKAEDLQRRRAQAAREAAKRREENKILNKRATVFVVLCMIYLFVFADSVFSFMARNHYFNALQAIEKNDIENAVWYSKAAVNTDKSFARAHALYGTLHLGYMGSYEESVTGFETALDRGFVPSTEFLTQMSEAYYRFGDLPASERILHEALGLAVTDSQKSVVLKASLQVLWEKPKFYRQIIKYTEMLSSLEPNESEHYKNMALASFELGDSTAYTNYINRGIKNAENAKLFSEELAGIAENKFQNPLLALSLTNRLLTSDSLNVDYLTRRAKIHAKLAEYENALADLNKVIRLLPDDSETYYNMAKVYVDMGKADLACEYWSAAKSFGFSRRDRTLEFFCEED